MFEKVNPSHPDKIADRIAGAIVDYCYKLEANPKVAVEVLIGHGNCYITGESSFPVPYDVVKQICRRITKDDMLRITLDICPQDKHLATNQVDKIRCGDNGIFKGVPVTSEQSQLTLLSKILYKDYPFDGKYIFNQEDNKLIVCQSHTNSKKLESELKYYGYANAVVNPLGDWTGGADVDSGATNRKLGSDMGDSVTGGGMCGKDLSKADVSVNIFVWLLAQSYQKNVTAYCAIGDTKVRITIDGRERNETVDYADIVNTAKKYIEDIGGFEKFAEWGLIR